MHTRPNDNQRLLRVAATDTANATLAGLVLAAIAVEETGLGMTGGWGGERVSGSRSELTSTERDAERAWELSNCREELRDRIEGAEVGAASTNAWLRDRLRWLGVPEARVPAEACNGSARPWEGHQLVWVPHSREVRNGWHDPTCRESAGRLGLCPACLLRMNRWRARNGMSWVSDARVA